MDKKSMLISLLGKKQANELYKLVQDLDKHFLDTKSKINKLLESHNLEMKVHIAFVSKDKK